MKKILSISAVLVCAALLFTGCSKQQEIYADNIELTSFSFEPASNVGLQHPINAVIEGNNIYIRVPNAIDITQSVPSFTTNSDPFVTYVGSQVQESGITPINLSKATVYRFQSPRAMSQFTVHALKNASILTFGFYAADNKDFLFKDYQAKITKTAIQIDLPIDADVTKLVARITTSAGATIKVNGGSFVSGKTELDYTQPRTLELSDPESDTPEHFVVTVGRLTAPQWTKIPLSSFFEESKISSFALDFHPNTNQPYVLVQLSGATDNLRKAAMIGYDAQTKQWFPVGAEDGFSETRVDVVTMAFDSKGTIYAAYKDYGAGAKTQNASLQKFENGAWSYVGGQFGSYERVTYLSMQVDATDVPYIGYIFGRAAAPYPNRGTYVESFKNGAWSGQTFPQSSTGFSSKMFKGRDNKLYYATMDLAKGTAVRKPSIYKLDKGTWSLVGTTNVGPSNSNSGNQGIDLDVTEDGQIYMVYQSNSPSYVTYVMHWDGTTWRQLGDGFAQTTSSTANRDNVAIKVHPDGRVFLVYGDLNNGVKVTTYNKTTGNWNPSTQVSTQNSDKFELKISKEGIPYLLTNIDSKATLFKYDIPGL
ncbi:hypothetical protein [Sphingobacterium sp. MYb382]|uniref:hypothetical protein n=1 Tax=Sphingobacterium sp. MYb382 TaxID=2745278 RepID=UPI003099F5C7